MVGAGSHVFAVWGYVIAKQTPDRKVGSQVDLNPKVLSFIIGDTEERIAEAIEYLCSPDKNTTTEGQDGRRLVKLGTYAYQVVNGAKYRAIRNEETRRDQNRKAQRKFRAGLSKPLKGESEYVAADGDPQKEDDVLEKYLPPSPTPTHVEYPED